MDGILRMYSRREVEEFHIKSVRGSLTNASEYCTGGSLLTWHIYKLLFIRTLVSYILKLNAYTYYEFWWKLYIIYNDTRLCSKKSAVAYHPVNIIYATLWPWFSLGESLARSYHHHYSGPAYKRRRNYYTAYIIYATFFLL